MNRGAQSLGILVTVVAVAALGLGAVLDPTRAAFAYLTAFTFCLTVAVGVLFWIMIAHATSAVWFVALRRTAESVLVMLPLSAILFVPIVFARKRLYPGTFVGGGIQAESGSYFSLPFFVARAVAYFAVLGGLAVGLRYWSFKQDTDPSPRYTARLRVLSSIGLPVAGLTLTFAAFDWLMSLDPDWESSMYGVYVCAGAALSGLAFIALLAQRDRHAGRLPATVGVSHLFVIGKLLLMLVLFWAYTGFCQLLLIWIADLPNENGWYLARSAGSWSVVATAVGVAHFALPFLALLSWRLKRTPGLVATVAAWLLGAHYLDVYWLVLPALDHAGPRLHWLDLAALVALGGTSLLYGALRARRQPPVPIHDPRLERSLHFENA